MNEKQMDYWHEKVPIPYLNATAESIIVYQVAPLLPSEEFIAQNYINLPLVIGHQSSRVTLLRISFLDKDFMCIFIERTNPHLHKTTELSVLLNVSSKVNASSFIFGYFSVYNMRKKHSLVSVLLLLVIVRLSFIEEI